MKKYLAMLLTITLIISALPLTEIRAEGTALDDAAKTVTEDEPVLEDTKTDGDGVQESVLADDPAKSNDGSDGESEAGATDTLDTMENAQEGSEEEAQFDESMTVDGVTVSVSAPEGAFPAGSKLSVKQVTEKNEKYVEKIVDEVRDDETQVAVSYTFDIKVLDEDGNDLQPADDRSVKVSFTTSEVSDTNLETDIYHITDEGEAEKLETEITDDEVSAETDGFSFYTVEFTYNKLQYVMDGNTTISLSEILETLGLSGEVTDVEGSNDELFSASKKNGEWIVTAHQAFTSEEWMKVTINDVVYEIMVTDNPYPTGQCTWYCWKRAKEKLGIELPSDLGHAYNWYSAASGRYPVGAEPRADSIIVMSGNGYGHVAYVEEVNGSTMQTTEGNLAGYADGTLRTVTAYRAGETTSYVDWIGFEVTGYIYLDQSHKPIGHIDSASGGGGKINVGGWAYDPDSVSTRIQVNAYIDGYTEPIASFKTHVYREIAGGTYCGFNESIDVSRYSFTGKKTLRLWGIDATGDENAEIGVAEISMGSSPVGHIDSASGGKGKINVGGWAYDPDSVSNKIQVNVYIDGYTNPVASFKTHIYREIAGGAYCGFNETIDVSKLNLTGKKTIRLWGIDVTGNANAEIGTAEVNLTKAEAVPETGVKLNKSSTTINVGATENIQATITPANATNKNIIWFSSDKNVAAVRGNGATCTITGKKSGTATITAMSVNKGLTAICNVTVTNPQIAVTGVTLDKKNLSLKTNEKQSLVVTIKPSNAANKAVNWSSSNINVATVKDGVVTAKGKGTATISVTTRDGGYIATCTVTVKAPNSSKVGVTGVKLNKKSATIIKGKKLTLKATITPSNATNKDVTWKSSNKKVATVDKNGKVKGIKKGTATITAVTADGKKTATCKVTVKNPVKVKSVKLNRKTASVKKGKSIKLKATISPKNATTKNVTWKSSNKKVKNGKVKGIKKGTATVTVTTKDGKKKAVCKVTVN